MATRLDPSKFEVWDIATKTKNLIARPLSTLVIDGSILSKFLLATLEGEQILKADSIVCVGIGNDVWQQSKKTLLKNYDISDFTTDGWMVCTPKPENKRDAVEVTEEVFNSQCVFTSATEFEIVALWGKRSGNELIQIGKIGDFILRNQDIHNDIWIVARDMFLNTYETLKESSVREELREPSKNVIPLFKKVI
jgi:hypothetical protein